MPYSFSMSQPGCCGNVWGRRHFAVSSVGLWHALSLCPLPTRTSAHCFVLGGKLLLLHISKAPLWNDSTQMRARLLDGASDSRAELCGRDLETLTVHFPVTSKHHAAMQHLFAAFLRVANLAQLPRCPGALVPAVPRTAWDFALGADTGFSCPGI